MASLAALRTIDETEIEINNKDGTGSGWFVTLAGPGHDKTRALNDRLAKQILAREKLIEQATVNGKKYKSPEVDPDERRRENIGRVVARIIGWRGLFDIEGPGAAEVKFSEEVAIDLFLDPNLSAEYSQINEYLNDERSFTKRSATT